MTFLTEYYDPKLELDPNLTPGKINAAEQRRVSLALATVQTAATIPRRLGPDATPEDMSLDKKRCRRVAHALSQPLEQWGGQTNTLGDVQSLAAQLEWDKWWNEQRVHITNQMRYIATLGLTQSRHTIWAKKAVTRLRNELQWVGYALR